MDFAGEMTMEPTPEETAALLKSATFIELVGNLFESLGEDRTGIWALADLLEEKGFYNAAWALRGRADGTQTNWFISGCRTREELPPGHRRKRIWLELQAIGTRTKVEPGTPVENDEDDLGTFPIKKAR
jgi:hypothetical protein